ncbi:nuclear transport factor 2 family protein [Trinickia dinghuensis]|uniref:Nuclear transport factor 2 family protein n=2 Tax=Trinickia dinghuensis TaxID=2291023 RepID=A0A3D8JUD5_9BURK|nr:nuclear transport factor 2 family protein [Trinickia dinghuensis]
MAGCLSLAGVLAAASANASAQGVGDQLRPRLDTIEKAWKAQDAEAVASVYGSNAMVTGEGWTAPALGHAEIVGKVKELMGDAKSTKIVVYKAQGLGHDAALTWVTWNVEPKKAGEAPFSTRSLFVWKKKAGQWQIVADMFAMGPMSGK